MESKTPKFDKLINEILISLKPHSRKCEQCKEVFEIQERDIEYFKKFQVPAPKMCPDCRRQRRLAFVNYTTLFKRACNAPEHKENMISSVPDKTGFPVFDFDSYWHGDREGKDYGREFNFEESFAEQFKDLFLNSPQPALTRDPASTNSEYTSYGVQLKDCYYVFGGMNAEDIMFTIWPLNSKSCLDMLIAVGSDSSYQGVYPENCYNCNFVYFSKDCIGSNFIYDCRNCQDCFGCVNLRNKRYCMWNEQYSEVEYKKRIAEMDLGNREELKKYKDKFEKLVKGLPIRAVRNEHSKNVEGNYILNSKDSFNSMWTLHCENLNYVDFVMRVRDSYDCTISAMSERLYSTSGVGQDCSDVKFSSFGRYLRECEYTMNCKNCTNCFGCIGVENAKFCIFNKQYSEDEYWKMLDEIKFKMLQDEEYGDFFPFSLSPFPYNASLSNIIFSINKKEAIDLGGWWHDEEISLPKETELIKAEEVDSNIKDISNDILKKGIISDGNGKPFRIVKKELDFYRLQNIALPTLTPYERIISRFDFVNNFKVFKDYCFKCGIETLSSYASNKGYKPYCEKCYQQEVY